MFTMSESLKHVVTLGNSIIGVSVLAMPYCFKQCGLGLGIVILMLSALVTRFNCHLLLKAALLCRRKTYEHLAFHSYGYYGKLAVETSIIGFLLGILVSFYVVIGDISPAIISDLFNVENNPSLRTIILTAVSLGVALPLGLLKNISSLGNISVLSFCFYACLIVKILCDAFPILISEKWWQKISFWRPEGTLYCLPIFSLALSCQTQIFEIYDSLPDPSLGKMNKIIKQAVNLCVFVYVSVGFLGYIAFCNEDFSGNVLINMPTSFLTQIIKLGFVLSVALSFPLVIFPCRTSLCSLLSKKSYTGLDMSPNYVSEVRFRTITISIVLITLVMGILCPNIELALGLVGSTIGTIICIVFPAMMFIRVTNRNILERYGAQIVLCCGVFLLFACTYVTIYKPQQDIGKVKLNKISNNNEDNMLEFSQGTLGPNKVNMKLGDKPIKPSDSYELPKIEKPVTLKFVEKEGKENSNDNQRRLEPPIPQEPDGEKKKIPEANGENLKSREEKLVKPVSSVVTEKMPPKENTKPDSKIRDVASQQEELLKKIERQQKEQMKLIEEQKHLLEELKAHKESHHKEGIVDNPDAIDNQVKEENKLETSPQKLPSPKEEPKREIGADLNQNIEEQAKEDVALPKESNGTLIDTRNEKKQAVPVKKEEKAFPSHFQEQAKDQENVNPLPTVNFQRLENEQQIKQDKMELNISRSKQNVEESPKEIVIPFKETKAKASRLNGSNDDQKASHVKLKDIKRDISSQVTELGYNVVNKKSPLPVENQTVKNIPLQESTGSIKLKPDIASLEVSKVVTKVPLKDKDPNVWRKDEQ